LKRSQFWPDLAAVAIIAGPGACDGDVTVLPRAATDGEAVSHTRAIYFCQVEKKFRAMAFNTACQTGSDLRRAIASGQAEIKPPSSKIQRSVTLTGEGRRCTRLLAAARDGPDGPLGE
jgi:hypothetical protein